MTILRWNEIQADEAYCIGPPPSAESYVSDKHSQFHLNLFSPCSKLSMDKIIDVCHRSGAQAVHPGYEFKFFILFENAHVIPIGMVF